MSTRNYVPRLIRGGRVNFSVKGHPKDGQACTVFDGLPNPSHRSANQWYDVRFDDGGFVRCNERDLQPIKVEDSQNPSEAFGNAEPPAEAVKSR